ncbi:MAG: NAD(P)-binding domain-containing protein [Oscillospiraceae bacterium]|jgi:pyrroline-5-carboxylate reductase|nr:NAD(P)-binding domain-containing protein [Oscillospiraceae bacterium]
MKFGIIGYGNLGRAFASALTCTGDVSVDAIFVCDISPDALADAKKQGYEAFNVSEINKLINAVDVIILVIKGYVFDELVKSIDIENLKNKQVISLMAGETLAKLKSLLGDINITRAMPSLAIATNDGVLAYTKASDNVVKIFNKFGVAFETSEENLRKVMAFAACGLGFAAYLVNAFKIAGESMDFTPEIATQITSKTFKNVIDTGNFDEIVKAVATQGGATEQGILYMNEKDVTGIVAEAMNRAYEKMS